MTIIRSIRANVYILVLCNEGTKFHPEVSIVCVIVAVTCKLSPFYKKNVRICSVIAENTRLRRCQLQMLQLNWIKLTDHLPW